MDYHALATSLGIDIEGKDAFGKDKFESFMDGLKNPIMTPQGAISAYKSLLTKSTDNGDLSKDEIKRRISILEPLSSGSKTMKWDEMRKLFEEKT